MLTLGIRCAEVTLDEISDTRLPAGYGPAEPRSPAVIRVAARPAVRPDYTGAAGLAKTG